MSSRPDQNSKGILLMVLSMASFAVADSLIKVAASTVLPAQVMFLLMSGGLIMFVAIAIVQGERRLDRRALEPIMILRYVAEVLAMFGMVLALKYVPISIVGAILQATPLLVALGAVLWLGETMSWRRWSAILVGFLGVLLIVQPFGTEFDLSILWAVLTMIGLAVRDLTTRLAPPGMLPASLAAYSMVAAIPFSIIWILATGAQIVPDNANWPLMISMVVLGSLGYVLLITSIRVAMITVVTPYRYSRLLFLLIIGVFVFDERPTLLVLIGAGLIVLSGLYTMWRERAVKTTEDQPTGA